MLTTLAGLLPTEALGHLVAAALSGSCPPEVYRRVQEHLLARCDFAASKNDPNWVWILAQWAAGPMWRGPLAGAR